MCGFRDNVRKHLAISADKAKIEAVVAMNSDKSMCSLLVTWQFNLSSPLLVKTFEKKKKRN